MVGATPEETASAAVLGPPEDETDGVASGKVRLVVRLRFDAIPRTSEQVYSVLFVLQQWNEKKYPRPLQSSVSMATAVARTLDMKVTSGAEKVENLSSLGPVPFIRYLSENNASDQAASATARANADADAQRANISRVLQRGTSRSPPRPGPPEFATPVRQYLQMRGPCSAKAAGVLSATATVTLGVVARPRGNGGSARREGGFPV